MNSLISDSNLNRSLTVNYHGSFHN